MQACAGLTGLRLGELRSLTSESYEIARDSKSKAPVLVIVQLARQLEAHRQRCRNALDLNARYQRQMKDVLRRAGISWHGCHGFRRGPASRLNRLGIDNSVIQRILRPSTVATTQNQSSRPHRPMRLQQCRSFRYKSSSRPEPCWLATAKSTRFVAGPTVVMTSTTTP